MIVLIALLFLNTPTFAQSRVKTHFIESNQSPQQIWLITPMIGLMPFAAREIGAKFSHEIENDGFIDRINDSISAEGSLFYGKWRDRSGASIYLSGNMRWDFHLVPEWTVFGAPGLSIRTNRKAKEDNADKYLPRVSLQLGGFWNIQPNLALRADIDVEDINPRVGVSFRM